MYGSRKNGGGKEVEFMLHEKGCGGGKRKRNAKEIMVQRTNGKESTRVTKQPTGQKTVAGKEWRG